MPKFSIKISRIVREETQVEVEAETHIEGVLLAMEQASTRGELVVYNTTTGEILAAEDKECQRLLRTAHATQRADAFINDHSITISDSF